MLIRQLEGTDAQDLFALRLRALQESADAFVTVYEEEAGFSEEQIQARCRSTEESFALGAFDDDGKLIGSLRFSRWNRVKLRHRADIAGMYVAPEARGKGVGRALMEEAIRSARKMSGLEQILLDVVTKNPAPRALYLSLGFRVFGVDLKASKLGDEYFDVEHMVLDLVDG